MHKQLHAFKMKANKEFLEIDYPHSILRGMLRLRSAQVSPVSLRQAQRSAF